jgi:outer membrane receptor protein involved in Fe transport
VGLTALFTAEVAFAQQDVVVSLATGSLDLEPEKADTLTVGGVFTPGFLPGFKVSVDYYDIKIEDAIGQLGLQNIVNQCFAGSAVICTRLERDTNGNLFRVNNGFVNINELNTSGLDIEGSYRTEFDGGSASIRVIASHVFELSTLVPGAAPVDRAGQPASMAVCPSGISTSTPTSRWAASRSRLSSGSSARARTMPPSWKGATSTTTACRRSPIPTSR